MKSLEEFRSSALALLEEAKRRVQQGEHINEVAFAVSDHDEAFLPIGGLPIELQRFIVENVVEAISAHRVLHTGEAYFSPKAQRDDPDRATVIVVQAADKDFGFLLVHQQYTKDASGNVVFNGDPEWISDTPGAYHSPLLSELWPPETRTLN